jgi:hypothetical protein
MLIVIDRLCTSPVVNEEAMDTAIAIAFATPRL